MYVCRSVIEKYKLWEISDNYVTQKIFSYQAQDVIGLGSCPVASFAIGGVEQRVVSRVSR